jgi:hypothetical protein
VPGAARLEPVRRFDGLDDVALEDPALVIRRDQIRVPAIPLEQELGVAAEAWKDLFRVGADLEKMWGDQVPWLAVEQADDGWNRSRRGSDFSGPDASHVISESIASSLIPTTCTGIYLSKSIASALTPQALTGLYLSKSIASALTPQAWTRLYLSKSIANALTPQAWTGLSRTSLAAA